MNAAFVLGFCAGSSFVFLVVLAFNLIVLAMLRRADSAPQP